jgi:hypothetical protein
MLYSHAGRFEVNNNLVKYSKRLTAIGRKRHLFFGIHKDAQNAAIFSLSA